MKVADCGALDEIFSHIDDGDGKTRHFNATAMIEAVTTTPGVQAITVGIDDAFAAYMLKARGIELPRLASIDDRRLEVPLIAVTWYDESVLIVDGHHRYVKRSQLGKEYVHVYLFPLGSWDEFLVEGV